MTEEVKELAKELQDIGLSEKEAKVYLATLELGQETVQNISKKANVNRATTYVVLESLQKKGIVTTFEQNKKTFFIAEGPSALYNIIREQQEELEKKDDQLDGMMNELMTVYNLHPDKPEVKFYEGKEGLRKARNDLLKSKAKENYTFYSAEDVKKIFSEEENNEFRQKRELAGVKVKAIYTDASQENIRPHKDTHAERHIIDHEEYYFKSDIFIYLDKVSFFSLVGETSGLTIKSKEVADTLRSIFALCESYLKNKKK